MESSKMAIILTLLTLLIFYMEGRYVLHWVTVLAFGIALAVLLFWVELGRPSIALPGERKLGERRDEVQALARIIRRAEKGKTARRIIEERIIEAYASSSEDYRETYSSLKRSPNEALMVLKRGGSFIDNLEDALRIAEADMNED